MGRRISWSSLMSLIRTDGELLDYVDLGYSSLRLERFTPEMILTLPPLTSITGRRGEYRWAARFNSALTPQ